VNGNGKYDKVGNRPLAAAIISSVTGDLTEAKEKTIDVLLDITNRCN